MFNIEETNNRPLDSYPHSWGCGSHPLDVKEKEKKKKKEMINHLGGICGGGWRKRSESFRTECLFM